MVSRRQETMYGANAPVRFYKIVAISFLVLTLLLLGVIVFMSAKRATITITTKPEPVNATQEYEIGSGDNSLGATVSTTVMSLSKTYEPTGTREETGVAGGMITIHNDGNVDQPLIPKTRFASPDGKVYRIKEKIVIPARGTLDAQVYADQPGKEYEIPPTKFILPALNEAKQKIIYAESLSPMKGGIRKYGVLTSDDIEKAKKALTDAFANEAKAAALKDVGNKSIAVFVTDRTVDPNTAKVGDEVSEFVMQGKATVVVVAYEDAKIRDIGKKALEKRAVSDNEIIEQSEEAPTVSIERYDKEKKTATLTVFQTGKAVLNPDSTQIQKSAFFGKSKDEVRRYLLSLDHVHGVDIEFHPAWMLTVPRVPDHVQVVVKNVE